MKAWRKFPVGMASSILFALTLPAYTAANSPESLTSGIVYEQRLGQKVSPELTFSDDQDRAVRLGDYFREVPVVLMMGYFRCPMLCGVSLNETMRTLEEFPPASRSRDFEFIFISVDPNENYISAFEKKSDCLRRLHWRPASNRWHFLTGGGAAAQLAAQIGFHYRFDPIGKQYVHPSGLVILSPEGKVCSYLLGIDYPAADFERALANARRGQPGVIGEIISILCFSHDPVPGSAGYYVLIALRAGAILTLIGLILLVRSDRRRRQEVNRT